MKLELILTSETSALKLVFWVAPVWFREASMEHQKTSEISNSFLNLTSILQQNLGY